MIPFLYEGWCMRDSKLTNFLIQETFFSIRSKQRPFSRISGLMRNGDDSFFLNCLPLWWTINAADGWKMVYRFLNISSEFVASATLSPMLWPSGRHCQWSTDCTRVSVHYRYRHFFDFLFKLQFTVLNLILNPLQPSTRSLKSFDRSNSGRIARVFPSNECPEFPMAISSNSSRDKGQQLNDFSRTDELWRVYRNKIAQNHHLSTLTDSWNSFDSPLQLLLNDRSERRSTGNFDRTELSQGSIKLRVRRSNIVQCAVCTV